MTWQPSQPSNGQPSNVLSGAQLVVNKGKGCSMAIDMVAGDAVLAVGGKSSVEDITSTE